jgi:hypothetical protein
MQITVNVPDTLPQERLKQRIKELELSLHQLHEKPWTRCSQLILLNAFPIF